MSIRVKVCLNHIFKDYRKEAFACVDPTFKHVCDFERHIQKLFNIQFRVYLTIGGSLLPSNEIIDVILSGDVIVVNRFDSETNDRCDMSLINNAIDDLQIRSQKIEFDEQSNEEDINPSKRGKRIRKRKRKECKTMPSTRNGDEVAIRQATTTETVETKNLIVQPNKLLKFTGERSTEVSKVMNMVRVSSTKTSSHITFSNDDGDVETDTTTSTGSSVPLNDTVQARVIRPVTVLTSASECPLPSQSHVEQDTVKAELSSTQDFNPQSLDSLRKFANDVNFSKIAASIDFEKIVGNLEKRNDFVALKEEPKTYDVLAFKMLKIGKNYEPQLSEWIIALVRDMENDDITLAILAGKNEMSCPEGKLSMDICEEEAESDVRTMKRGDMLNVKVYRSHK